MKKHVAPKKVISLRLREDILRKLQKMAKRDKVYVSDVIRNAVSIFLLNK